MVVPLQEHCFTGIWYCGLSLPFSQCNRAPQCGADSLHCHMFLSWVMVVVGEVGDSIRMANHHVTIGLSHLYKDMDVHLKVTLRGTV